MRRIFALTLLVLAACSPRDDNPREQLAKEPAPSVPAATTTGTVTDFSQPMIARGTEPFWAVEMNGTTFTLKRPDQPDTVFNAPGAQISPGRGVWPAAAADGRRMTVTLYVSDCSDGMSDLRYPMAAEVAFEGGETLRGCAAKVSDMPKPPAAG